MKIILGSIFAFCLFACWYDLLIWLPKRKEKYIVSLFFTVMAISALGLYAMNN